jgi:hypothetical protein
MVMLLRMHWSGSLVDNVRQHKKGPKTTLGVNLETGEQVWLTIQAPTGYVRVNEERYWRIIRDHLQALTLAGTTRVEIRRELEKAAYSMAKEIAEVIRETAPIDEGALRASILALPPGTSWLDEEDRFPGEVMNIEPF